MFRKLDFKILMKYVIGGIGVAAMYWLIAARTPLLTAATIFALMIW